MNKLLCLFVLFTAVKCSLVGMAATVTTSTDSGPGSLREAIAAAAPGDTIDFAITGAISLTSGELRINKALKIAGPGPASLTVERSAVPGTPEFRLFELNAPVSISGLTLSRGRVPGTFDEGGAILNLGNLTLSNSVFSGNSTGGDDGRGGAIYNEFGAALTIDRCVFAGNSCAGAHAEGGGVYLFGTATINDCTFAENTSSDGGAFQVDYFGTATISRCTFSSNSAPSGVGQGGGIHNVGALVITNCTFSGNSAQSSGGAIYNDALSVSLRIHSSTFSDNSAAAGSALFNDGNLPLFAGTIGLRNSIVAGNLAGADIHNLGTINSSGHNLVGTTTGNAIPAGTGDQFGVSASSINLGPLQNNGGPTFTRALRPGSIALDAGDDLDCPGTDQRGQARPFGPHCDVGAYEADCPPSITCPNDLTVPTDPGRMSAVVNYPAPTVPEACSAATVTCQPASGSAFPKGSTVVTCTARYPSGNQASCSFSVKVEDREPPVISSISASPNTLSPVNHQLRPVVLKVQAKDNSGPAVCKIKSVNSSDPVTGTRPGDKAPDWEITGALTLNLRAERSAKETERIYTITVECRDGAGNVSTRNVAVTVPAK